MPMACELCGAEQATTVRWNNEKGRRRADLCGPCRWQVLIRHRATPEVGDDANDTDAGTDTLLAVRACCADDDEAGLPEVPERATDTTTDE